MRSVPLEFTLEAASRIGRRIVRRADWDGKLCNWQVKAYDRANPRLKRALPQPAAGEIYQGTAGIALFLAELARVSGQDDMARTAAGAVRHALDYAAKLPLTSFGFHSGRVGIAFVATRVGEILGRPDLLSEALQLLEPMAGLEHLDRGLDLIGGAGGAIPALIHLHGELGDELPLDMAIALGDHLVRVAHREPGGWSWSGSPSAVRNLAGLAHGAAGIGLALLELARATGLAQYRFAAEMAFLYESRLFDRETSNWPDLRHTELGEYLYPGREAELREAVASGTLPDYQTKYMAAWCHGSPGVGLSRVRAFELTGQEHYRREAEAALRSTLVAFESRQGDFSLCHGVAGNCELPLYAAEIFGDPALRQVCERYAADGWERYGQAGRPWPCGTVGGESDPSLMLGEAGIGYFYLRLAEPDVPSLLLLRPTHPRRQQAVDDRSFEALRRQSVDEYFEITLRTFEALRGEPPEFGHNGHLGSPLQVSPVESAYQRLQELVDVEQDGEKGRFEDAFRLDRERYRLTLGITDFTTELLRNISRPSLDEIEWQRAVFRAAEHSQVISTRHDWSSWLSEPADSTAPAEPSETEMLHLLYRQNNRIHDRQISPFTAVILEALATPVTLSQLVERVAETFGQGVDCQRLLGTVEQQVRHLYQAGFVDLNG